MMLGSPVLVASPAISGATFRVAKDESKRSRGNIRGWLPSANLWGPFHGFTTCLAAGVATRRMSRMSRPAAQQEGYFRGPSNLIPNEFFAEGQEVAMGSCRMQLLQSEALRKKVRRDLGDELEDDVWESLKVNLREDVMDALKDELEDEVRETLQKELGNKMGMADRDFDDDVAIALEDEDAKEGDLEGTNFEEEMEADKKLDAQAAEEVAEVMSKFPTLSDETKQQIQEKVCEEMRKEMKVEVVLELKEDLREQAEEALMEELEAEARFELREELEEEVRNDLLWDS